LRRDESRRMNPNDDVVYRCLRLWPLYQLHPGRSRRLVRYDDCLHHPPPCVWYAVIFRKYLCGRAKIRPAKLDGPMTCGYGIDATRRARSKRVKRSRTPLVSAGVTLHIPAARVKFSVLIPGGEARPLE